MIDCKVKTDLRESKMGKVIVFDIYDKRHMEKKSQVVVSLHNITFIIWEVLHECTFVDIFDANNRKIFSYHHGKILCLIFYDGIFTAGCFAEEGWGVFYGFDFLWKLNFITFERTEIFPAMIWFDDLFKYFNFLKGRFSFLGVAFQYILKVTF